MLPARRHTAPAIRSPRLRRPANAGRGCGGQWFGACERPARRRHEQRGRGPGDRRRSGRVTDRLAGRFHSARDVTKPRAHRSLAGEAKASVPPRHSRIIRGELANWTRVRVTTLYSVDPRDPDHDAAMRIDGEAPGRQSHSQKRHRSQGSRRVTAASDRHRRFVMRGRPAPKPFAFAISLSSVMTPYAG